MTVSRHKSWELRYTLTTTIAKRLMEIESARAVVEQGDTKIIPRIQLPLVRIQLR